MPRFALVSLIVLCAAGCARTGTDAPVQLVVVSREGAPALAVFHDPDVRINALSVPALEFERGDTIRFDRGTWTADSAYFAEPPWMPKDTLRGRGTLHVSFCRTGEAYCTVHSYPVEVR